MSGIHQMLLIGTASTANSRQRWRIYVTATDTAQTAVSVAELEFRATAGGANLAAGGGTASASSQFDAAHNAQKAFDTLTTNCWATNTGAIPAWLRFDLTTASVVNEIALRARSESGSTFGQTPKDFIIQSSPDGTIWQDEWSVTGQTGWTTGEVRVFTRP